MNFYSTKIENIFDSNRFQKMRETKKVVEYKSVTNGKYFYFRRDIGLPNYIRVVINPNEVHLNLVNSSDVSVNKTEFQHGSNMLQFPKRINGGEKEIPYGRALNIKSENGLTNFISSFHAL